MRGRQLFQIARPVLVACSYCAQMVPYFVCEFLLICLRHVPTKFGIALRYVLVRRMARACGECVAVCEGVHLIELRNAVLGNNVTFMPMCYVDATGGLQIDADSAIAHHSSILTTEHDYSDPTTNIMDAQCLFRPTHIGRDVWVGCGVRILSGVTIGDHVVIGAGAVVTHDIPSNSLAVGVPASVIKQTPRANNQSPTKDVRTLATNTSSSE